MSSGERLTGQHNLVCCQHRAELGAKKLTRKQNSRFFPARLGNGQRAILIQKTAAQSADRCHSDRIAQNTREGDDVLSKWAGGFQRHIAEKRRGIVFRTARTRAIIACLMRPSKHFAA